MVIKVFVGNLPENASEDALHDLFAPYGEIPELHIVKNFAFVSFFNRQDAENSVKDLHQTKMSGNTLIVEISKKQDGNSDSRRDGPRGHPRSGHPRNGPPMHGPPLGGILGAAPIEPANPLGALGVFSAANTLAAVENQVRQTDMHLDSGAYNDFESDRHRNRSVDNETSRVKDGYVIYERYYVDASHPLLKGLPLPKLNRMTDSYVSPREPEVRSSYNSGYGEYRRRSPGLPHGPEMRSRDYSRPSPYSRR